MRNSSTLRSWKLLVSLLAVFAMFAAACGSGDAADEPETDTTTEEPADEEPAEEPADEEPAEEPADEESAADAGGLFDFSALAPPTGDPIIVGYVNTEGPAGLNFPELEEATIASVDYLNEHGGLGNRPIELETCVTDGSPESSQGCAQELAGKNVEMVWLGLDLFPDYATYEAAGIPLVGVLPLFPADYGSNAIYLNGGNVALAGGQVAAVVEFFGGDKVSIISADNAGANSSEAAVIAALEVAGVEYRSIKGAESETDAGAQGLVAEALSDEPDVLISLYGDAGCIGMIRGRAALGSDIPVIASNTCGNGEVLDAVGDDAEGWYFVPGGDRPASVENAAVREAVSGMAGVGADDVILSDLGLGRLAPFPPFTAALAANLVLEGGSDVTGVSISEEMKLNPSGGVRVVPDGGVLDCGAAAAYPSVCDLTSFLGEYVGNGEIGIVAGQESVDVTPYLP